MYFDRNIDLSEKISMAKKVCTIIRRTAFTGGKYFRDLVFGSGRSVVNTRGVMRAHAMA